MIKVKPTQKFYFMGYDLQDENQTYSLLFVSEKATSLFEALKEYEEHEITKKRKCKIVRILEDEQYGGLL